MGSFVAILIMLLLAVFVASAMRRRGGLIPQRGMGVGADLGTLGDKPRVRVEEVTRIGSDRVHLVLTALASPSGVDPLAPRDLDLVVHLDEQDFGFGLLREWQQSGAGLGIVLPPESHLVRLRSLDDLQPLTLRRVDQD